MAVSVVAFLLACAVMGANGIVKLPADHKCAALNEDIDEMNACYPPEFADFDYSEEGQRKFDEAWGQLSMDEQDEIGACSLQASGLVDENYQFSAEISKANINQGLPADVREEVAARIEKCGRSEATEEAKLDCVTMAYDDVCDHPFSRR